MVHSLWENSTPPPHVLEQRCQGPHRLQPPSTTTCSETARREEAGKNRAEQSVRARCQRQTQLCSPNHSLGLLGLRPQPAGTPRLQAKSVLKFGTRPLSASARIPATCVTLCQPGAAALLALGPKLKMRTWVSRPEGFMNLAKLTSRRQRVWVREHVRGGY